MPGIYVDFWDVGRPVGPGFRMFLRELSLRYLREGLCPLRRPVMRHRVRLPAHREARLPRMSVQENTLCYRRENSLRRPGMRHRRAYPCVPEARLRRAYVLEARLQRASLFVVAESVVVEPGPGALVG